MGQALSPAPALFMFRPWLTLPACALLLGFVAPVSLAQASQKAATPHVATSAERGVTLAQSGHCKEALPLLKQATTQAMDKDLKRGVGFAGVRCAMFADQPDAAEDFLRFLNREFPKDPEVLYLSVHTYSDLSSRAAAELATTAPKSPQGLELNAEAYEAQGKWDEAAKEYRLILEQNPRMAGIHFRIGRLLLSKPNPSPTAAEEAKKEMQQELEIDPSNAGAEYVLGALAQQNQQWDDAIAHFSRAAKLDPTFGDAFVGLGASLGSAKRYSEAIPPLENAVKLEPENPAPHYLLAIAYSRTGRKEDGDKQFAIQRKLTQKGAAGENSPPSQAKPN
jgi:tetratricopeptide (TPR) repeat protein